MMTTLNTKLKTIRLEFLDLANNAFAAVHGLRMLTLNRDASLGVLYSELCYKLDLEFRNG